MRNKILIAVLILAGYTTFIFWAMPQELLLIASIPIIWIVLLFLYAKRNEI